MASQAALEIILQARDEASKVIENTSGALDDARAAVATLGKVGAAVAGTGIAAAGGALTAVAGSAFNFSQEIDAAMATFQAQTGEGADELAYFRDQALSVFEAGYGENIQEITNAMGNIDQVLGPALQATGEGLDETTQRAIALRDTFGVEMGEAASVAGAAIKSGLVGTGQEAFDLLTTGFQQGLNQAYDFGDTIREYSSDFERLGFSAEGMLGTLNAGLEEGAYNTDVVADGIREFGIRFGAAEETAVKALDAIGLDSENLYEQYEAGGVTVADVMETVTGALQNVDSQTLKAQAGAALFGTKWEDIGGDVFIAAGQARDAVGDITGATDRAGEALERGLGPAWQRMKRRALTAIAPIGDSLSNVLGQILDDLGPRLISLFESDIQPAIEVVTGVVDDFAAALSAGDDPVIALQNAFRALGLGQVASVIGAVVSVVRTMRVNWEQLRPVLVAVGAAFAAFSVITTVVGWITGLVGAIGGMIATVTTASSVLAGIVAVLGGPVTVAIVAVAVAVGALAMAWQKDFLGMRTALTGFWTNTAKPALQAAGKWLGEKIPVAVEKAANFWTNTLQPALSKVSNFITETVIPAVETLVSWLQDNVPKAVGAAKGVIDGLRGTFDRVRDAIQGVIDKVIAFVERIRSVSLPDWLTGGSPAPLELWVRGIADAMEDLAAVDMSLALPQPAPAVGAPPLVGRVTQRPVRRSETNIHHSDTIIIEDRAAMAMFLRSRREEQLRRLAEDF